MKINLKIPGEPGTVYVSFSGGADSTALLLLMLEQGLDLCAVHFEHGIRGLESREDAAWCREFCEKRGVKYIEIPLDVPGNMYPGENLEAAARRLRLEAWREFSNGKPITIMLGHHADDRVETMLMRLARGSNASGAAGLDHISQIANLSFLRPLLDQRREEIEQFLTDSGVTDWRMDCSNSDESYQRNYLRGKALPEWYRNFPPVREGLLHAARALSLDADFIEASANRVAEKYLTGDYTGYEFWRQVHPALIPRLLRIWLGGEFIPDRHFIRRFQEEIAAVSTETRLLEATAECELCFDRAEVWRKPRRMPEFEPVLWNWHETPELAGFRVGEGDVVFDAALLPDTLEITAPRPGDVMVPFGANSPKKLQKLILDAKLSAREKSGLRVLRIPGGEILWVPGLRRSNCAPVTDATRKKVSFLSTKDTKKHEK